ncbi:MULTISPECIES: hypothetical protein [Metabacillus]|uniref:hypothetical protein n=2 Tax=Bacillaceae TaxID=186817 RepID=UPI000C804BA1|nr:MULTISPECIES: hypothetical protein [Metabacillus]MCM3443578.1 hypothetical protein [Metabacillus halosaccharovorans]PMC34261.1 hypothetical protein CJ195_24400 [Bacillus sp. UMB0899]
MKPKTKVTLGILTFVTAAAFTPVYDLFIKDKIDSVEVVVVKPGKDIQKNEQLLESMFVIERRDKKDIVKDVIYPEDLPTIIGYDSSQLMVGNSIVSKKMIDYDNLIPDSAEGEAIRPLMSDMIFAQPGSLRRKDTIDIYLVDNALIEQDAEDITDGVRAETVKNLLKEPVLKDVKVVYVKDSSNREVTNDIGEEKTTTKTSERLNATGTISDLEVILNEEDFQKLMKEVIENDKKLYITYN